MHGIPLILNVKIDLVQINHIILMKIVKVIYHHVKLMVLNVSVMLIYATH